MPRIRTIKPKLWDDKKISKLTRDARLIFVAMWNFADDNGAIIADLTWLKSKILPYDDLPAGKFAAWIQEILNEQFIACIQFNGEEYFYIDFGKNSIAGQVINRPNQDDVWIEKSKLATLLEDSKKNHVSITETSVPERKGIGMDMERKGEERKKVSKNKVFLPPTLQEVISYFNFNGYNNQLAENFFKYYDEKNAAGENWVDSKGNKVRNWKQKAISVWFKDSHKLTTTKSTSGGIADSIANF